MFFQKKPLSFNQESIGWQLKLAREQKKLKFETIAKKLIIKPSYLQALENNDFGKLPKGVYVRNFLREYARFLGLDHRSLLKQLDTEILGHKNEPALFERQVVAKKYLLAMPIVVRNFLIILVAAICLIYIVFLLNKIFKPPWLEIIDPAQDKSTTEQQLIIIGQTEPETNVLINGQLIKVNNDGKFSETIYLEPGLNTIVISAKKKYSQVATAIRRILLENPPTN